MLLVEVGPVKIIHMKGKSRGMKWRKQIRDVLKRKERLKGESRSMGQTTLELVDVERGIEQMKKVGAFPPFFLLSESINEGKI